jgi:hypothetical protein
MPKEAERILDAWRINLDRPGQDFVQEHVKRSCDGLKDYDVEYCSEGRCGGPEISAGYMQVVNGDVCFENMRWYAMKDGKYYLVGQQTDVPFAMSYVDYYIRPGDMALQIDLEDYGQHVKDATESLVAAWRRFFEPQAA